MSNKEQDNKLKIDDYNNSNKEFDISYDSNQYLNSNKYNSSKNEYKNIDYDSFSDTPPDSDTYSNTKNKFEDIDLEQYQNSKEIQNIQKENFDIENKQDKDIGLQLPTFERIICKEPDKDKDINYLSDSFMIVLIILLVPIPLFYTLFNNNMYNLINFNNLLQKVIIQNIPQNNLSKEQTQLHLAVKQNNVANVKYLLQKGAPINQQNRDGDTSLHYVAKYAPNEKMLKEFYKYKDEFDLSLKNNQGKTPRNITNFDCFEAYEKNLRLSYR